MDRINIGSGSEWEQKVGYSRAVRVNNLIEVAGTTAVKDGQVVGKDDPYLQTKFILQKIAGVLKDLGAGMEDVIRTRMYVVNINDWEVIGRAHAEFFSEVRPAATMVEVQSLIHPDLLVELEVTAMIDQHIPFQLSHT